MTFVHFSTFIHKLFVSALAIDSGMIDLSVVLVEPRELREM